MENFLLNLIKQRLANNEITNYSIISQLKLADIDLKEVAQDIAKSLEITDNENLTITDIKNRQLKMSITDQDILAYFERKKYTENSLPKLRDRIKITKKLTEISDESNSSKINDETFQRPFEKKSKQSFEIIQSILKTDYITTRRHSSESDLKDLNQIFLKDMFVNKIHHDLYLECFVVSQAVATSGIYFQVKDIEDQYENVILYNFEAKSINNIDPSILLPIGTKIIIKEPHLKIIYGRSDDYVIRIDSPTDLIISYDMNDENPPTDQIHSMIRIYSKKIENKSNIQFYLKRSELYFKLEKYDLCFQDASKAFKIDKKNLDSYFLMGKSAYAMRKYKLASENFIQCLKLNSKCEKAKLELNRVNARITESKTGVYDTKKLMEQYLDKTNLYFDIADFKSDRIEIYEIENKSKGIKAVDFIEKGTLLVVSKAVSAIFSSNIKQFDKGFIRVHTNENIYEKKDMSLIISDIVYKMQNDSNLAKKIYALYAGPEFNREVSKKHIDISQIENIITKNSFDVKNHLEAIEMFEIQNEYKKQLKSLQFTMNQLDRIDLEALNFESDAYKQLTELKTKYNYFNQQRALWLFPSYFNHSCIANCFHICIGDVMMIYTRRNINKGEELTLNYLPSELKYSVRVSKCEETHNFKCDCELCELDENDPMRSARDELLKKIFLKDDHQLDEALADLNRMRCTYLKRSKLQIDMIFPLEILALKYRNKLMFKESAKCYEEIFQICKDSSELNSLGALREAYIDYERIKNSELSEACKAKAFDYFIKFNSYFEKLWDKIHLIL